MYSVADLLRKVRLKLIFRKIKRYKLEKWLELSDINNKIQEAADTQDFEGVSDNLIAYVSAAIGNYENLPWVDFYLLYAETVHINNIDDKYPILKFPDKKQEKKPWEYFGRSRYFWIHTLGKAFGWTTEYILNLDINDAIALLQEIEITEQLDREFWWDISEVAYSYDANTKTSKHNKLERPPWMSDNPISKYMQHKRSKPPAGLMPIGNVQSVDDHRSPKAV